VCEATRGYVSRGSQVAMNLASLEGHRGRNMARPGTRRLWALRRVTGAGFSCPGHRRALCEARGGPKSPGVARAKRLKQTPEKGVAALKRSGRNHMAASRPRHAAPLVPARGRHTRA
jgi:hypothetical protein